MELLPTLIIATVITAALFFASASVSFAMKSRSNTSYTNKTAHVAVVFFNESFAKPLELLADAVAAGAEAAGAEARLLSVNGAWPYSTTKGGGFTTEIDQEKDLLQWADAIVSVSHSYGTKVFENQLNPFFSRKTRKQRLSEPPSSTGTRLVVCSRGKPRGIITTRAGTASLEPRSPQAGVYPRASKAQCWLCKGR